MNGSILGIGAATTLWLAGAARARAGSRSPVDILDLIGKVEAAQRDKVRPQARPARAAAPPAAPRAAATSGVPATGAEALPAGGHVNVQTGAGRVRVSRHRDGQWSCTCVPWRQGERPCAHIQQVWSGASTPAESRPGPDRAPASAPAPAPASAPAAPTRRAPPPQQQAPSSGWRGVMKAERWTPGMEVTGHLMSEKYDGYRAYWDGSGLYSKNGHRFAAPLWFVAALPRDTPLDGELYLGPGRLDELGSILRRKVPDPRWSAVTFRVFDAPEAPGGFAERSRAAKAAVERACRAHRGPVPCPHQHVEQVAAQGPAHLQRFHRAIVARGGEGTVLRAPSGPYLRSRSHLFLKVKDKHDAEAKVVGHEWSTTNPGQLGAYKVKDLESGALFEIGIGIDAEGRRRPLPVGSIITYAYRDLTKNGVPRGAIFVRERKPE